VRNTSVEQNRPKSKIVAVAALIYALVAFAGAWVFFACFIFFLGNLPHINSPWLPTTVDRGATADPAFAAAWNTGLVIIFGLQHSVMARPSIKRLMASLLPHELERATYVHAANIAGFILIWFWIPIPQPLWTVNNEVIETLLWIGFAAGWLLLFTGAFSINLFELLGLRQALGWLAGERASPLRLKTVWIYRYVEHPMYVGVLMALWLTPHFTVGHALLAAELTLYVIIGMQYERRDLRRRFGTEYAAWSDRAGEVPLRSAMLSRVTTEPVPETMARLLMQISSKRAAPVVS
jgi:protein-S-isoprenylcysteine O-methyltransferase Ste14